MDRKTTFPFYHQVTLIIVGIIGSFFILYMAKGILLPLIFATLLAILLNPLVNFFNRKKMNRTVAIFLSMFLALVVTGVLVFFIMSQISMFSDTFPQLKLKLTVLLNDIISWFSDSFNVSHSKIDEWIKNVKTDTINNSPAAIGQTLSTLADILILTLLLPVYVFMVLFYKSLLLEFIRKLFPAEKHAMVAEVLNESKQLTQKYLLGLLIEAVIVAILNSAALLIIGIEYAVLLGIIGAMLNIIPYIGGIVAVSLPVLIALAVKTPLDALWVMAGYIFVQFIDNNFIVPYIVASRVRINALVSVVVVLIGGALWGVPGMFLSIPLTAIIKVIFDRIEPLKPYGFLLGDNTPIKQPTFRIMKKAVKE